MLLADSPHLQKHQGKALDRVSFEHDGGVFPVSEPVDVVDVLIGQIHAAVECSMPINDQNLAVVPIIIMSGHKGRQR